MKVEIELIHPYFLFQITETQLRQPECLILERKTMLKNYDEVEDPNESIYNGSSIEEFDDDSNDDGYCDVYNAVMGAIFISRPLGLIWDEDLIEDFLISKGYKIIERSDENGELYRVPVKSGSKIIPDQKNSLRKVFDREIQKTLLKWLSNIG